MVKPCYFRDEERFIDFILVFSKASFKSDSILPEVITFLSNLEDKGLEFENENGMWFENYTFVKVHAPKTVLLYFSEVFNIDLECQNRNYIVDNNVPYKCMATEITRPNPESKTYKRAPNLVSGEKSTDITNAERIIIVHKILATTRFGTERGEMGIEKLLKKKIIVDAYPLHDSKWEWTDDGFLSNRQLLARYWGNFKSIFKQQPYNLIEKYYGSEIAFYFAWLGFYNKMLIPVAIIGTAAFTYGVATINTNLNYRKTEVCSSDIILCPRCFHYKYCKFTYLRASCLNAKITYLFDNPATICFAVLMSFWATTFIELWKRRQAVLQLKWNLMSVAVDNTIRPEFEENTKYQRISRITGQSEPYTPTKIKVCRYSVTAVTIIILVSIVIAAIISVITYRVAVRIFINREVDDAILKSNRDLIASITSALISVAFIEIFEKIYNYIAIGLTNMENARTQQEYDDSYIYKQYAFAFANNYGPIFYLAFFKGRFYTYPGDKSQYSRLGGIQADTCDPSGCILNLCIQLVMILTVKGTFRNIKGIILPRLQIWLSKSKLSEDIQLPLWEEDLLLMKPDRLFLVRLHLQMILQYGFVILFVAAFPLAPLLALLKNLFAIRADAVMITKLYRRAIPKRVGGLAAWNGILQAVTFIGVVTNAVVIAITSDFVPRQIYKFRVDRSLKGFINITLSEFAVADYNLLTRAATELDPIIIPEHLNICFYQGNRYPPGHEHQYIPTEYHYYELAIRFLVIMVFEHLVLSLTGILAYAIPNIPYSVRQQLKYQEYNWKEERLKMLNEKYLQNQVKRSTARRLTVVPKT